MTDNHHVPYAGAGSRLMSDWLLGLVAFVLGVALFVATPSLVEKSSSLVPGSTGLFVQGDFIPRVVAAVMAAAGLVIVIGDAMNVRRGVRLPRWPLADLSGGTVLRLLGFFVALVVWTWAIFNIGFIVSGLVALVPLTRWLGAPSWRVAALVAISVTVGIYLLFVSVFGVPIPDPLMAELGL